MFSDRLTPERHERVAESVAPELSILGFGLLKSLEMRFLSMKSPFRSSSVELFRHRRCFEASQRSR